MDYRKRGGGGGGGGTKILGTLDINHSKLMGYGELREKATFMQSTNFVFVIEKKIGLVFRVKVGARYKRTLGSLR